MEGRKMDDYQDGDEYHFIITYSNWKIKYRSWIGCMIGKDVAVTTEDVTGEHLAKIFTEVTGHKANATDLTNEQYFSHFNPEAKTVAADPDSVSFIENFTAWWYLWHDGLVTRDYEYLNSIHPNRLSLKTWMQKNNYDGITIDGGGNLKQLEDGERASLRKQN